MTRALLGSLTGAAVLILLIGTHAAAQRENNSASFENTRSLLLKLKDPRSDGETLAVLFQTGDERMEDLIRALDDPDNQVSLRAQAVIRYLGNETGMTALVESYGRRNPVVVSGPVPLPLNRWDYTYIAANYLRNPPSWDMLSERYVYALALDNSQTAQAALNEVIKAAGNLGASPTLHRAIRSVSANEPDRLLTAKKDFGRLVLENAFFVDPADRKHASVRLLALNASKDKGLIELYINRGPLAEEWYHVVIRKIGRGWKFFSITQVAVS